jgi:hypothetical protein
MDRAGRRCRCGGNAVGRLSDRARSRGRRDSRSRESTRCRSRREANSRKCSRRDGCRGRRRSEMSDKWERAACTHCCSSVVDREHSIWDFCDRCSTQKRRIVWEDVIPTAVSGVTSCRVGDIRGEGRRSTVTSHPVSQELHLDPQIVVGMEVASIAKGRCCSIDRGNEPRSHEGTTGGNGCHLCYHFSFRRY